MILNRLRNAIRSHNHEEDQSEDQCLRCETSWIHRDLKQIRYQQDGSKAAPLCEKCFDEVDHIIASRYFHYLWSEEWGRSSTDDEFRECYQTFMRCAISDKVERGRDPTDDFGDPMEMRNWAPSMSLSEARSALEDRDVL